MAKWILIGLILVMLLYLNRAYAYFFDYLDAHQGIAAKLREKVEFRPANFPGKLTYVALGDSLTYGTGAKDLNETYPYLVAQHLIGPLKGDVDEYNLGIPGATTDDVIKFELNRVTNLSPQVITLLIGINDALSIKSESSFQKSYNLILDQITAEPKAKVLI